MRRFFAIRTGVDRFILSAVARQALAVAGVHPFDVPARGRGKGVKFPVGVGKLVEHDSAERAGDSPHAESVA